MITGTSNWSNGQTEEIDNVREKNLYGLLDCRGKEASSPTSSTSGHFLIKVDSIVLPSLRGNNDHGVRISEARQHVVDTPFRL